MKHYINKIKEHVEYSLTAIKIYFFLRGTIMFGTALICSISGFGSVNKCHLYLIALKSKEEKDFFSYIENVFHSGQCITSYTGIPPTPQNSSWSSRECSFIFGHL